MPSDVQTLRFRQPNAAPSKQAALGRHTGVLQDQLRRAQRRPWNASFSLAVRILVLMRFTGAMYSNIDDCDEVFNFWEPLHFFLHGYGFQTWEVAPQYAIRSWAYIFLHYLPPRLAALAFGSDKRVAFFALRICLGVTSALVEAAFYRAVVDKINERVGRYVIFMLLFSAGMWNSSAAFLPSSFAMYANTLAFSFALAPASLADNRRTIAATILFAAGGIIGWPFSLAIAIPFMLEELFVCSADRVPQNIFWSWMTKRWARLLKAGLLSLLLFIPVVGLDSLAYGKLAVVPWNIVRYNIFGDSGRGPELYGTAPWSYYFNNLFLNFNFLFPLALLSLPALAVTYFVDRKRVGFYKPSEHQSSPFTILALRLAPFYLWLSILTLQAHKEERFMFPAYPLLCLNAAVTIYLMRGWLEVAFIKMTKSPYQASQSLIFRNFTFSIVVGTSFISVSRILALWHYYHSPMSVAYYFQAEELPRLLNVTGFLPEYTPGALNDDMPPVDLSPIKHFDLQLCLGKEWHRFHSHYLIPNHVRVNMIRSDFHGLLPGHFTEGSTAPPTWWLRPETWYVPKDQNDMNKEELSRYIAVDECDYLIDLDFPRHPESSALEPRYAVDPKWKRVVCLPFLDARNSHRLTRMFWLPGDIWQSQNDFGDYCLLRNKGRVGEKEMAVKHRVRENTL